jgi:adenylylsulfate kinase-like enzyme
MIDGDDVVLCVCAALGFSSTGRAKSEERREEKCTQVMSSRSEEMR